MQKVLITGIDSFTGHHLSTYLAQQGYDVYGTSLIKRGDKLFRCDITDTLDIIEVLQKVRPDFLIHLSGISFPAHGNNEDFYRVNTLGTINLLEALLELDIAPNKVILASSATVYGNQNRAVLDESLCPQPANHYGASKFAMESLVANYFEKLPILITRPFNYTGVGQAEHFLIPKIVKHFREKHTVIELGSLNVRREFNDVGFVCEVYRRLLSCTARSQTINLCSGRGIQLLDVIETMNTLSGYAIEVEVNPAFVRKDEIQSLTGSVEKLFEIIGEVKQKPFEETLRGMLG
ncbi:MAG TPA: NAD-dependent epimerase/dehydratase family protein [Campylobacterales bacterium]|nr:NAD-dependent epimerase/dehydratase family protein [Campylobacterales bacterium]